MLRIPGLLGPEMRRLHADDDVGILFDRLSAELWVHLVDTLLQTTVHSIRHNVQKGQHPHLGMIDDFFLLLKKRLGSGGTCVN